MEKQMEGNEVYSRQDYQKNTTQIFKGCCKTLFDLKEIRAWKRKPIL